MFLCMCFSRGRGGGLFHVYKYNEDDRKIPSYGIIMRVGIIHMVTVFKWSLVFHMIMHKKVNSVT